MKEIQLSQGKVALVDDEDYISLSVWKWHFSNGYACHREGDNMFRMHRVIMSPPENLFIDHINGDKLDNQKKNLRICTEIENNRNRKHQINSSGYKGVYQDRNKWRAQVSILGKRLHVGNFKTPEEAAKAYDEKAKEIYGEFANINFK